VFCVGVGGMRSSIRKWSAALALAGSILVAGNTTAAAQGFFEQLFGIQQKPQAAPSLAVPQGNGGYTGLLTPGGRPYPPRDDGRVRIKRNDDGDATGDNRTTYRTLCVRTCDGYYFPISNSTTKREFYNDQAKCKSTCGGEARLFVTPTNMSVKPKESLDSMVDLNGMPYMRLPMALKYRKTLVAGCQCKPDPWSDAELNRHRRYAEAEQRQRLPMTVATATDGATAIAGPKVAETVTLKPSRRRGGASDLSLDAALEASRSVVAELKPTDISDEPATSKQDVRTADGQPVVIASASPKPEKSTKRASRTADGADVTNAPRRTTANRATQSRGPVPVAIAFSPTPPPPSNSGGFFGSAMGLGGGASKYSWPGDAPRR
jgi:hypothetical protein